MARAGVVIKPAPEPVPEPLHPQLAHEIAGFGVVGVAVFLLASLVSFHAGGAGSNIGGPIGETIARFSLNAIGLSFYLVPLMLGAIGVSMIRTGADMVSAPRAGGAAMFLLGLSVFLGLFGDGGDGVTAGGWVGGFLATVAHSNGGPIGAYLAAGMLCMLSLMVFTGSSLVEALGSARAAATLSLTNVRARRVREREVAEIVTNRRRQLVRDEDSPVIVLDNVIESPGRSRDRRRPESLPLALDGDYQIPCLLYTSDAADE